MTETNCAVHITGGELPKEEVEAYIARGREQFGEHLFAIDIHVDGEFVDLDYHFRNQQFHRIRRITGYLVGTLDRFNDGKRAEEHDRVKHAIA